MSNTKEFFAEAKIKIIGIVTAVVVFGFFCLLAFNPLLLGDNIH